MALYFLSNYIYDDLGNSSNSVLQFPIVKSGTSYGYKTSKTGSFVAFRGDSTDTYTYASGSTGSTVDLGARNTYRYINASNVYNKGKSDGQTTHTQTYTFPVNDTGSNKDLGVNHAYRYVNATNVYNKGKADGHITQARKVYSIYEDGPSVPMPVIAGRVYVCYCSLDLAQYLTNSTILYSGGGSGVYIFRANFTGGEQHGNCVYYAIELN